jgi:hypothetical protein
MPTNILNNKLNILLPKDFVLMNNKMLEVKYPIAERRPTEVYTDDSGAINIAISLTNNQVSLEQLPDVEKALKKQFARTSNITLNSSKITSVNGRKYVILNFYSQAIDARIYNLMYVTSLNDKMLLISFNCKTDYLPQWHSIGQKIIGSIKIL